MEEKKRFFDISPLITFSTNDKEDYKIYNKVYNRNDRHQFKFSLYFESLEEYFFALSYLTGKGWFNKIASFGYSLIPRGIDPSHVDWYSGRKKKIEREKFDQDSLESFDFNARHEISIIVDWNKRESFRKLLKEFPGFKTQWKDDNDITKLIIV